MSYISHVDYKKMMDGFKKGTPKQMLKEDLEQEGNAFTAGLAKAKKGQEFKVGGKSVKDTSNYDSSMEEEMHSFDGIKKDTSHAHKLKVNAPNFTGTIFKNEDGTYVFYDVDNHNADPSLPPFKTITDLMKHFGIKMQDLHEDLEEYQFDDMYPDDPGPFESKMEESHPGMDKWYEDFENGLQNLVKNGYIHKNQYKYFHDALDHVDPMQDYGHMPAHDAAKEFVDDLRTKNQIDADDYQWKQEHGGYDYDGGVDDFNDGEFWENEVKKLQEIAGVKPQDDGPEDDDDEAREKRARGMEDADTDAENAERDIDEEAASDGSNMRSEREAAKVVAQKHPELKQLYDKYEATKEEYAKMTQTPNYANTPEFQAFSKERNAIWKKFENDAINWCGHEMLEAGMNKVQVRNLLSAYGYFEDWVPDYLQALSDIYKSGDMEEGLHMPPLQATGPTVDVNEDQAPFGMSVLSPDERKQLKEFIESYKTIKKEIANLLEKAGKDPRIMENAKRIGDEAVPAERPAHYNEPTKTPKHKPSNLGGNRTGLVMTKAEMWEGEEGEHERIESMLNTKLHDAFHKVTGMIMKDLMADGFDEGDIKNFLQHEIDEKAKEAINAQHDF